MEASPPASSVARRSVFCAVVLSLLVVYGCEAGSGTAMYDVVLFNYLDRPIFDVYVDKKEVGVAGEYPNSGHGTMSGMRFAIGPKTVTWRLDGPAGAPRLGEKTAKNHPEVKTNAKSLRFLAVHIYPDDTVEFSYFEHFPGLSQRGEALNKQWAKSKRH